MNESHNEPQSTAGHMIVYREPRKTIDLPAVKNTGSTDSPVISEKQAAVSSGKSVKVSISL